MAVVDIERSDVCNGSIFDDFSGGRRLADVRFERGAIDDNVEELTGDRTKTPRTRIRHQPQAVFIMTRLLGPLGGPNPAFRVRRSGGRHRRPPQRDRR